MVRPADFGSISSIDVYLVLFITFIAEAELFVTSHIIWWELTIQQKGAVECVRGELGLTSENSSGWLGGKQTKHPHA